ncbi:type 1 glutamine amidotransferase domain-containing protein [Amnibacterium setariae]|uniref:Type 1 glutamine amidotransferase n=1 Tax=Amnibacterium setariae TaxID=2306585 RepID=A0A3A1U2P8_9MICO|nr:type 1 glutamine amidotransferase domain-containing protein [Amnibacterium setariae]RIX30653.1 type 1 glutamine amidotransferase [Amnibacterium setariae]
MAEADLGGRKVLAIVTNYGVEQDELVVPLERLRAGGATVDVAAQQDDDVVTLVGDKDPGRTVAPDTTIGAVDPAGYDLLLLPGGAINADNLRLDEDAVRIAEAFVAAGRPIAAICHAPWTLVEAGAVRGKRLTSYASLQTDLRNAGADWADESVVVDDTDGWTLITSRDPDDLDDFVGAIDRVLGRVSA